LNIRDRPDSRKRENLRGKRRNPRDMRVLGMCTWGIRIFRAAGVKGRTGLLAAAPFTRRRIAPARPNPFRAFINWLRIDITTPTPFYPIGIILCGGVGGYEG